MYAHKIVRSARSYKTADYLESLITYLKASIVLQIPILIITNLIAIIYDISDDILFKPADFVKDGSSFNCLLLVRFLMPFIYAI